MSDKDEFEEFERIKCPRCHHDFYIDVDVRYESMPNTTKALALLFLLLSIVGAGNVALFYWRWAFG